MKAIDTGAGAATEQSSSSQAACFWKEMLKTILCQVLMRMTKNNKTGEMGILNQMIVFLTFFG